MYSNRVTKNPPEMFFDKEKKLYRQNIIYLHPASFKQQIKRELIFCEIFLILLLRLLKNFLYIFKYKKNKKKKLKQSNF